MIELAKALTDRARTLPWRVFDSDATGATTMPYLLILPPAGGQHPEHALGGPRRAVSDELMVRAVAASADAVRGVLGRSRTVFTGTGLRPLTFDTAAWRVTLSLRPGATPVLVDRDTTMTSTNVHPLFATDFYDLTAVPLDP